MRKSTSTKRTIDRLRALSTLVVLAALLLAPRAEARRIALPGGPRPYIIEGYLDRAPDVAKVIDRVEIFSDPKAKRWLLVTRYGAPGEINLDRYLSWPLEHTYAVGGKKAAVARLLRAPAGAAVKGTFLVYRRASPMLVISQLDVPAE